MKNKENYVYKREIKMKTIGLIGGMSWESSALYYQRINQLVHEALGGLNSAKIIFYSVNFKEIEKLQRNEEWECAGNELAVIAKKLEDAGCDAVALCTNTMHKVAPQILSAINIPFLHIIDAVAAEIQQLKLKKVVLLGTKFTMGQAFYITQLINFGIDVVVPHLDDQLIINRIIYDELCQGIINPQSKEIYKKIIQKQIVSGAEGVILGCTELGLIVDQADFNIAILDTTEIHVRKIVDFILQ